MLLMATSLQTAVTENNIAEYKSVNFRKTEQLLFFSIHYVCVNVFDAYEFSVSIVKDIL